MKKFGILLILTLFVYSCNSVKRVKENEQLLTKNTVIVNGEKTSDPKATTVIKPAYGLTESDITRMISEANSSAEKDMSARRLSESKVEAERVIYALEQALDNDGSELLDESEYKVISSELSKLKEITNKSSSVEIDKQVKILESKSEFYVERRMNKSIQSLMTGKGVDDVLE